MPYVKIADLKGRKGDQGERGPKGDTIERADITENDGRLLIATRDADGSEKIHDAGVARGPRGFPGTNGVPTAQAIAENIAQTGPVRDALDSYASGLGLPLSATKYGAKGDGTTDDTTAIQAAIAAGAGREVQLPSGRYRITGRLDLPDGTTLRGEPGTVLVNDGGLETVIKFVGTAGPEVKLAAAVGTGDRTITTSTAHGLAVGDTVRLTSQRVSTSVDAGEWRLGVGTDGGSGPFFGEFGSVQKVVNATTVILDSGLIFPGYRPDRTQETDSAARDFATIAKISGAGRITVQQMRIEGPASLATIYGANAVDCIVDRVVANKPDKGVFVQFESCYRTEARDCWVSNDMAVPDDVTTFSINSYKIAGSQSSGFDRCIVLRGTQGFDVTYMPSGPDGGRICASYCYVRNSRSHAALRGPLTVHPGTYASTVVDNDFSECGTGGVTIRGNRSKVSRNEIRGRGVGMGIYLSDGGGCDSLVSLNHVVGFETGLAIVDGAGKMYDGRIGIAFCMNMVLDCLIGYARLALSGRPLPSNPDGITLDGNHFYSSLANAVAIAVNPSNRPVWGTTARNNRIRLTGAGSVAMKVGSNARATALIGNDVAEAATLLTREAAATQHVWPAPSAIELSGTIIGQVGSVSLPANDAHFRLSSRDRSPLVVTGALNLDHYRESILFRPVSTNQATVAAGFPTENAACDIEVIKRSDSSIAQRAHYTAGDMYTRWLTSGGAWSSWTKRY